VLGDDADMIGEAAFAGRFAPESSGIDGQRSDQPRGYGA
jgi:hypothetical protein